jgi:hypothetical protein
VPLPIHIGLPCERIKTNDHSVAIASSPSIVLTMF